MLRWVESKHRRPSARWSGRRPGSGPRVKVSWSELCGNSSSGRRGVKGWTATDNLLVAHILSEQACSSLRLRR